MIKNNDETIEFDIACERLRIQFQASNINEFLLCHNKLAQLFTKRLQAQIDSIPLLENKQIKEININASPEAISLLNALSKTNNLELKEKVS